MTDQATTSDLLAPATPSPITTQQVREAAFATMQKLRADPDYKAAYLRGDKTIHAEVTAAHAAINTPTALKIHGKDAPEDRAAMIGSLQNFADVPEPVQRQLYQGEAVSAAEQKWARSEKSRCMTDRDWCQRYLDGGQNERQRMLLLNTILTSPTRKE
jgi:hypothetical protein